MYQECELSKSQGYKIRENVKVISPQNYAQITILFQASRKRITIITIAEEMPSSSHLLLKKSYVKYIRLHILMYILHELKIGTSWWWVEEIFQGTKKAKVQHENN